MNSVITAYYLLITTSKEGEEKDETSILHEESSTPRWMAMINSLELSIGRDLPCTGIGNRKIEKEMGKKEREDF